MIADLEEERKCYARESARRADFALMLQTERDKLLQQVWLECKTWNTHTFCSFNVGKRKKKEKKRAPINIARFGHLVGMSTRDLPSEVIQAQSG